jgi:RHS repeat-associated protein
MLTLAAGGPPWTGEVAKDEGVPHPRALGEGGRWLRLLGRTSMRVDRLGSTTFLTDHFGDTTQKTIYYPWGQMWRSAGTVKDERFASMEQRDAETGNDPTLFRMYQPRLYRWLSPDPVAGDILNPQSLNRYAYVLNNPTNFIDPTGQWPIWIHGDLTWWTLGGLLSSRGLRIVAQAGTWLDLNWQSGTQANLHGMCTPNQNPTECKQAIWNTVGNFLNLARDIGPNEQGLWYFGTALHILQDWTSPAHVYILDDTPKEWRGGAFQWITHTFSDIVSQVSLYQLGQGIRFGAAAWWYAFPEERPSGFQSPSQWADSTIRDIVGAMAGVWRLQSGPGASGLLEGAAAACALGNPAACGLAIPGPVEKRLK